MTRTVYRLNCRQCKQDFNSVESNGKFCSRECSAKHKINKRELKCDWCSTEIQKTPCRIKSKNFCSKKCHDEYQSEHFSIICKICGVRFEALRSQVKNGKKYCSEQCQAIGRRKEFEYKCLECGKIVKTHAYRQKHNPKFCSHRCKGIWMSKNMVGQNNPLWILDKIRTYPDSLTTYLKIP